MQKLALTITDAQSPQHNLLGQRLGRKGRDTRERILAATQRLLDDPANTPISLSAVAREASLGMTTLYLYFSDLTSLLIAVLAPIMASAEESYVGELTTLWPDAQLGEHSLKFMELYHDFWRRNSRILHLRNSLADAGDIRMHEHRIAVSIPVIEWMVRQMQGDPSLRLSPAFGMATVLITGIERMITVTTDANDYWAPPVDPEAHLRNILESGARLLELGIRDRREAARATIGVSHT